MRGRNFPSLKILVVFEARLLSVVIIFCRKWPSFSLVDLRTMVAIATQSEDVVEFAILKEVGVESGHNRKECLGLSLFRLVSSGLESGEAPSVATSDPLSWAYRPLVPSGRKVEKILWVGRRQA